MPSVPPEAASRRWTSVVGRWLRIGAARRRGAPKPATAIGATAPHSLRGCRQPLMWYPTKSWRRHPRLLSTRRRFQVKRAFLAFLVNIVGLVPAVAMARGGGSGAGPGTGGGSGGSGSGGGSGVG